MEREVNEPLYPVGQRRGQIARHTSAIAAAAVLSFLCFPALAADLPSGLVRLSSTAPSIRQDIRYAGADNFLGRVVAGYAAPACILTEQAASALARVQALLAPENLSLVVFDCYRPERAVSDMIAWTKKGGPADARWFPAVRRGDLIRQGYVGERSNHSRGSTVDLAIAPLDPANAAPDPPCGAGGAATLDFGTGFDCFDPASKTASKQISKTAQANRQRLVALMRDAGFKNYSGEWWHFLLEDEPFTTERFDFAIEAE